MKITFLGTSCMVPTQERNHQSIFLSYKRDNVLLDCGEGTQRQLKIAKISPAKIGKIFISHWHGDHVLGLPGLLQTLNSSSYEQKLDIYGPAGTKKYFEHMFQAFSFEIGFDHEIHEIEEEEIVLQDLIVRSKPLQHSVPTIGYSFSEKDIRKIKTEYVKKIGQGPLLGKLQENEAVKFEGKTISPEDATYLVKGKKVAVVLDTIPTKNAYELAKDADLLISEAVYTQKLRNKAEQYMHMTAQQSAQLASQSNVKELVLTHFSQRYKTSEEVVKEASTIFPEVKASYDMMKIKV